MGRPGGCDAASAAIATWVDGLFKPPQTFTWSTFAGQLDTKESEKNAEVLDDSDSADVQDGAGKY